MNIKTKNSVVKLSLFFLIITGLNYNGRAQTTKQVELPEFHTISVNSDFHVTVRQSNKQEVTAKVDPEIWSSTNLWVNNGVLHIDIKTPEKGKKNLLNKLESKLTATMELSITVEELKKVIVNSDGDLTAENSINADQLEVEMNGTGKITIDARAKTLIAGLYAPGEIVLSGYADELQLNAGGDGNFNGVNFDVKRATATIRGISTKCHLNVSESLDITVKGSAEVFYKGDVKDINKKIYGNGFVLYRN